MENNPDATIRDENSWEELDKMAKELIEKYPEEIERYRKQRDESESDE